MGILYLLPSIGPVLLRHVMDVLVCHGADCNPVHGVVQVFPEIRHAVIHIRDIDNALVIGIAELHHGGHKVDDQHGQR